ncbi:MAG: gluconokinase [Pseudomonadota bacterium]
MVGSLPASEINRIVVMGVAGCGKSTVAEALAEALDARYLDGDAFHPPENIDKMSQGVPLTDADRWPWLDAVAEGFGDQPTVIACSALRRAYRDRLRARGDVFFAFLDGSFELIQGRMAARAGHFMPESLLESQFATLEPPAADEWSVAADISGETEATVAQILHALGR